MDCSGGNHRTTLGRRTHLRYPGRSAPVLTYTYTPDGQLHTVQYEVLGSLETRAKELGLALT